MAQENSKDSRYLRAEELLAQWLEQADTSGPEDLATLLARHPDLATEMRSLAQAMGVFEAVVADGRARVEAERDALADLLAGVGGSAFDERYRLEGEVGKGGMGVVFRVHDKKLGRALAMKVILGQAEATRTGRTPEVTPRMLQRFLNEARLTGQLEHPGIVPVHEVGVDADGRVYFTMKLVKGRTLADVIKDAAPRGRGWSRERVLQAILRVCDALSYAHERSVVHRDLKPQNVMVGDFGEVYVMDWGLARRLGEQDNHLDAAAADAADEALSAGLELTRQGAALGTPAYMPPEQAAGRTTELGAHSDVYAVGAMLYESISGHPPYCPPWTKRTSREILDAILASPPTPLPPHSAPPELLAICNRAMARDWRSRYASIGELAEDLRSYIEGRTVAAYRTGPWIELKLWTRRNRLLATSFAVTFVVLVVAVAATTWIARKNEALAVAEAGAKEVAMEAMATADAKVQEFHQLAGLTQLDKLLEWENDLYPAWPARIPDMERWIADVTALRARLSTIDATLATLRAKARRRPPSELETLRAQDARYAHWLRLRDMVTTLRHGQEVRHGRAAVVEPVLPARFAELADHDRWSIAIPMVHLEPSLHTWGKEATGLALLRSVEHPQSSVAKCLCLLHEASALFWLGRDTEAMALCDRMIANAPPHIPNLADHREELRKRIAHAASDEFEREVQDLENKLTSMTHDMDEQHSMVLDDPADQFLYEALYSLRHRLQECDSRIGKVEDAQRWARAIGPLSLDHPHARHSWQEAREAIARADDAVASSSYADCTIPLCDDEVLGLVPLGMNPKTRLWEFYDLRSAWDGVSDPREIPIPAHESDGSIPIRDAMGIVLVLIPGGAAELGADPNDVRSRERDRRATDNERVYRVALDPFLIARHELTQGQWHRLWLWEEELRTPASLPNGRISKTGATQEASGWTHPVESVSLPMCERLLRANGMILPTESQWEFACRAGTTTQWFVDLDQLRYYANVGDAKAAEVGWDSAKETWNDGYAYSSPVGSFLANAYGLYDMHGNVEEWCRDCFGPTGGCRPGDGLHDWSSHTSLRVMRGGSFALSASRCRSASRSRVASSMQHVSLGVRATRLLPSARLGR